MERGDTSLGGPRKDFSDTAWSVIQRARDDSAEIRQSGFEDFCKTYWKPIYQYLRMAWRKSNEDAKDLTQAFFVWLADPQILKKYAPERGTFRIFLKTLLRHFVQHQDEALRRMKRGGSQPIVSLEQLGDAGFEGPPDPQSMDPEAAFEKQWRSSILSRAIQSVQERLVGRGREIKLRVFEAYCVNRPLDARVTYSEIAQQLSLREADVKQYLLDVREEMREEISRQLAETVSTSEEFEEEWKVLGV